MSQLKNTIVNTFIGT
jgi:hypothetical protein